MALFSKETKSSLMDAIRCDNPSYLIWKWRPNGETANSNRTNAIRWGSPLRVKPGSVAVLAYSQPDGYIYDYIEGPADTILETSNLPVLADIIGRAYNGGSPFQAEVYFINLAELIQVPFGVPFFDVFDPRFTDYSAPIAVRGTINFKITDYQEFIRLHQLNDFDLKSFQIRVRDTVIKIVKSVVINVPAEQNIPVVQIEQKILEINTLVENHIKEHLYRDFGVSVSRVDISAIEIDKTSDSYHQLKAVTQDISTATIQAQAEVNIQNMRDEQRLHMEHTQETLKVQREESQYAQRLQTQSEHFAAHQLNQQAAVGIAGAETLRQTGTGGSLNPAGMMMEMAVGSAIGQNIAGMVNSMMPGINTAPPPVPSSPPQCYYIAINGQATGPHETAILQQMVAAGTLTGSSLIWTAGMSTWVFADKVPELKPLFTTPPDVPPEIPPIPSN